MRRPIGALLAVAAAALLPEVAGAQAGAAQQPPSSPAPPQPAPAPPGPDVTVVERREKPNPKGIIATDAVYGGVAGLLVGAGVALVKEWDSWQRDVIVGAGAGLLVGAAVGVAHALYEKREYDRQVRRVAGPSRDPPPWLARDGLGRTDRDPVITGPTLRIAVRF